MKARRIAVICGAVFVTILTMQNMTPVEVQLLFWKVSFPLILVIGIILVLGFIVGFAVRSILVVKRDDDEKND